MTGRGPSLSISQTLEVSRLVSLYDWLECRPSYLQLPAVVVPNKSSHPWLFCFWHDIIGNTTH